MADNKTDTISSILALREELKESKEQTGLYVEDFNTIRYEMNQIATDGNMECCKLKTEQNEKVRELTQKLHKIQCDFKRELADLRSQIK